MTLAELPRAGKGYALEFAHHNLLEKNVNSGGKQNRNYILIIE